jgi:hypothetical protein
MKPIILTGYTHHIAPIAELCLPSKQAWADSHGCELIVLRDDMFPQEQGHPSFQKLRWIHATLGCRNVPVIWLDADSMITNLTWEPWWLLPMGGTSLRASRDYNDGGRPPHKAWSAGNTCWLPTQAAFDWLDQAMLDPGARWGGLWDQDALQACQPDNIIQLSPPRTMNAVHPDFGLEASWKPGDFLIHFTGIAPEDRHQVAQKFINDHLTQEP